MDLIICYFKEIHFFMVMLAHELYFKQYVCVFVHTATFTFSNFRNVHCFKQPITA